MIATAMGIVSTLGRETLRIVLPAWCIACGDELHWSDRVASCCLSCWESLPRIACATCVSCARPWSGDSSQFTCLDCQSDPTPLGWCYAWGHYKGGLERIIHAFKFGRHDFLDRPLGGLLAGLLLEREDLAFDALVPVPMTPRRQRARGYNQAELLARASSKIAGIPVATSLLARPGERPPQAGLPKAERRSNVRGVFVAAREAKGRSLLLVDDVCTTAETLRACAVTLLRAGARRVCAISVAKAG